MVPAMHRFSSRAPLAFVCGAALLLGSTSGCVTEAPQPRTARKPHPVKTAKQPTAPKIEGPALLTSHTVASLEGENALAIFARRGQDGLLLTSSHGRWQTRLVGADGAPKGADAIDVAPVPEGVQLASLRAAGDGYL